MSVSEQMRYMERLHEQGGLDPARSQLPLEAPEPLVRQSNPYGHSQTVRTKTEKASPKQRTQSATNKMTTPAKHQQEH